MRRRVTVVGSVCLCVCVSVKSHLTSGASVRPENTVTYSAGNESQNPQDLQAGLNVLQQYCLKWALTVTHSKTKVLIFGSFGSPSTFVWSYNGTPLEQVFSYLIFGYHLL